jgi:hypothetical protein
MMRSISTETYLSMSEGCGMPDGDSVVRGFESLHFGTERADGTLVRALDHAESNILRCAAHSCPLFGRAWPKVPDPGPGLLPKWSLAPARDALASIRRRPAMSYKNFEGARTPD